MTVSGITKQTDILDEAKTYTGSDVAKLVSFGLSGVKNNGIVKTLLNQLLFKDISEMGNIKTGKIKQVFSNFGLGHPDLQDVMNNISTGLDRLINSEIDVDSFFKLFHPLCDIFSQKQLLEQDQLSSAVSGELEENEDTVRSLVDYKIVFQQKGARIGGLKYVIYVGEREIGRSPYKPKELTIFGRRILAFDTYYGKNSPYELLDLKTGKNIPKSEADVHEFFLLNRTR